MFWGYDDKKQVGNIIGKIKMNQDVRKTTCLKID